MKNKHNSAFTIVELLVVIVVIGILAAITIVSYSGVQKKAIVANLQSDLSSDAKMLKLYNVEYGHYPTALDANNCPSTPEADTRYCLKYGLDTTFSYTGGDQNFRIKMTKNGITYLIREDTAPYPASAPTIGSNTVTNVVTTVAQIGATISSDGGDDITNAGTCWGTTANPTTNCVSSIALAGKLSYLNYSSTGTSLNSTSISPDGKHVYATSVDSSLVHMFSRDSTTNILTALSTPTVASGTTPYGMTSSPDGKSVYVAALGANVITILSRNATTGILTSAGSIAASSSPSSVIVSSDNKFVYASNYSNGNVSMYSRNTTTGALTSLGTVATGGGTPYSGIALSPDGTSLYVSNQGTNNVSMLSRNTTTGLLTLIGNIAAGTNPQNIVVSPDSKFVYVSNNGSSNIYEYSRNTSTGELTSIGNIAASSAVIGLVISPDGKDVYAAGGGTISYYDRNSETGLLTSMSPASGTCGTNIFDISIAPDGESIYFIDSGSKAIHSFRRYSGDVIPGVEFTRVVRGLTAGQTVHYRSYATNSIGTTYSDDATFVAP